MITRRLVITGRVQGVGFRDWLVEEATRRGVHGWVRNRHDGAVEALLHGHPAMLAGLLAACREGPRHASVSDVAEHAAAPPDAPGFHRGPSA